MAELKDSGERREFETGAMRDVKAGKGRMDLVPFDIVSKLLSSDGVEGNRICLLINDFKHTGDIHMIYEVLNEISKEYYKNIEDMILDVSHQYEDGAKKYGINNWMLGMSCEEYLDSGTRHYMKHRRGDTDEPHLRASVWNFIGLVWTTLNRPELKYKTVPETLDDIKKKNEEKNHLSSVNDDICTKLLNICNLTESNKPCDCSTKSSYNNNYIPTPDCPISIDQQLKTMLNENLKNFHKENEELNRIQNK